MPFLKRLPLLLCLLFFIPSLCPAQNPELILQTGHTGYVLSVTFNPNGKMLASVSDDQTIKLWDAASGAQLLSLDGHVSVVTSVVFSPNGRTLASGSSDNTIKLWDVASGTQLRSLAGHSSIVTSVAFSPDGKTLASSGYDGTVKLWDVTSGTLLRSFTGHRGWVHSVAFSRDGRTLASGGDDRTVNLWSLVTGEVRSLICASAVRSVAFSPDGRTLATGSFDHTIRLWDMARGAPPRLLVGHTSSVNSVAFSPDGKMLASGGDFDDDRARLWDVETGRPIRALDGTAEVAFSPDGKMLASINNHRVIRLWDVMTGALLRSLDQHAAPVLNLAFSPDGKTLASSRRDGTIKLWDTATGTQSRTLVGHSSFVNSVAFSPDGRTLASGSYDYSVKLWNVASGTQSRTLVGHAGPVFSVAFSPNGKTLASSSYDHTVRLWDIQTGALLRTLTVSTAPVPLVTFSPDGKTLVSADESADESQDRPIKIWDIATGARLRSLPGQPAAALPISFSPDGQMMVGLDEDKSVKVFKMGTGAQIQSFAGKDWVQPIVFSPDGKTLAAGSRDYTIKLWDVASGTQRASLGGYFSYLFRVAFSPDGEVLACAGGDAKIKLWDTKGGRELASLISLDEEDWLVAAPDGLFDGSNSAWGKVIWRASSNSFDYVPVEAYFADFFHPGLLADIFTGQRPRAPVSIEEKDRRPPQLKLTVADAKPNATVTTREIVVQIKVSEAPAGARDVRLFRNGSLVKLWEGNVLKGQSSAVLTTEVPVMAGVNRLTAYAFNQDNVKSGDVALTITGADSLKRRGTAYVLAVGVDHYSNPQYRLEYSVADAQAFGVEFVRQQLQIGRYERVEVTQLLDKEATKFNILLSLRRLAGDVASALPVGVPTSLARLKPAQPEDAVIIYFAGHGAIARQRFYLLPHDLGYQGSRTQLDGAAIQTILTNSISDVDLEQALISIDAGHLLLVIDACNSGQALEAEEKRRGPMNSKGLAQLAYEKGMYIMTAAQSYQDALESSKFGHGYLTYALVEEGLKTAKADISPQNGEVTVREWLDFATLRVPQLQEAKSKSTPQTLERRRQRGDLSTSENWLIQRPRVFYRRLLERQPLIVAKPARESVD